MLLEGKRSSEQLLLFRYWDILAAIEVYFDESGTHDGSMATLVGGAMGEVSLWIMLSERWKEILDRHGVFLFHATDLNNFRGEYDGWDERKRRQFTSELLDVIIDAMPLGLGIGVDNRVYDSVKSDYLDVNLSAYQFCCEWCISWANQHAKHIFPTKTVAIVFEAGRKLSTPTIDYINEHINLPIEKQPMSMAGIASVTMAKKAEVVPLQVADLIAYELYKYRSGGAMNGLKKIRHPLAVIFANLPSLIGGILGERRIREYLETTRGSVNIRKNK